MIKNRRAIKVVLVVILIISVLQLTRMGLIIEWSNLSSDIDDVYKLENVQVLSKEIKKELSAHRILFIPSNSDDINHAYMELMGYLKLEVDVVNDLDETLYDLTSYDLIICSEESWSKIAMFRDLMNFVQDGGRLILNYGEDSFYDKYYGFYSPKLGIIESGGTYEVRALEFYEAIIPGIEKVEAKDDTEHLWTYTTAVQLSDDVEVLVVDKKKTPLLWKKKLGKGYIGVNNSKIFDLELNKAFTLGLIEEILDNFVYPIVDTKVIFIDDFPGKFVGNNEKVQKEYGRNIERFLAEIWWPDMVSTITEFDLVYTAAFITSYNDNVEGNFDLEQLITEKDLIRYGREIFKYDGEISFHGYNHQSLVFDQNLSDEYGYKSWKDTDTVKGALNVAKKKFNSSYPNYMWRTYVPPSNLFDEKATDALLDVVPTLEVFSGVLYSDVPGVLVQNFSVDERGIVQLPRVSSGTIIDSLDLISILSVARTNGVVNHFIHPDDFMDEDRGGGMTWEEMFKMYSGFLKTLDDAYPWMSSDKAYSAGQKVKQYHYMKLYTKFTDEKIVLACDNFDIDQSLILKTDKVIKTINGASIEKIDDQKYLVKMHKNIVVLEVE